MVKSNGGKINLNIKFQDNKLDIKIVSCQGLKDADWRGKSDPYVKLFVLPGRHTVLKTKTVKENLNPVYNSTFSFTLSREQIAKKTAVFQVFDDDLGKDDKLGEARIPLNQVNLGHNNDYSLELQPFTTTPPVATSMPTAMPSPSSAPMIIQEQNRPRVSTGSGYHEASSRQSFSTQHTASTVHQNYTSHTGSHNIRDLNNRLDEIIRKNGSFHDITDELIVRLVSKQIQEQLPEDEINAELGSAFAYTSEEMRELARLMAENARYEEEVKYLQQQVHFTGTVIQTLKSEEENLDKMIISCQRDVSHWESERTRVSSHNWNTHDSTIEGKFNEFSDRWFDYYMWELENHVALEKERLMKDYVERTVTVFTDRVIQSPTIIWGMRGNYSEHIKISLENMNMEIRPFQGILDDIHARYQSFISNLATCDVQEREFRSLYDELREREKELSSMRMDRANLRFDRDRNLFSFLSEFRAKEAALEFLKQEWNLIVNRVWDSVQSGNIDQREINRYCDTIKTADNNIQGSVRHYESSSASMSNITGVRLTPQLGSDGSVNGWKQEHIYA